MATLRMNIIDRRLNPKGRSLGNRRRFIQRARDQIREAINENLRARSVSDVESGERVSISPDGIHEPRFLHDPSTGRRAGVLPGNLRYREGDEIPRPEEGGGGKGGAPDGEGQDDFVFALSREEFLDLFFEDLELPDLVKQKIKAEKSPQPQRAGYSTSGPQNRLNVLQTLRRSHARRLALRRPGLDAMQAMERELERLRALAADQPVDDSLARSVAELESAMERAVRKRSRIAYIDPIDLRFRRFERIPRPIAQAVMFCLMDVSASMDENRKDLAKRFFLLLHLFLDRHYEDVDVVFIRHTSHASEVDEETFFHGRETGGTVVSTAFEEMLRVVRERYPTNEWNIYLAQASDGDDLPSDVPHCVELLERDVLPLCQYAAYVEVGGASGYPNDLIAQGAQGLWTAFSKVSAERPHFAIRRIGHARDIYPVFRGLFSREGGGA